MFCYFISGRTDRNRRRVSQREKLPPQLLHALSSPSPGRRQRRLARPLRPACQRLWLEARHEKVHVARRDILEMGNLPINLLVAVKDGRRGNLFKMSIQLNLKFTLIDSLLKKFTIGHHFRYTYGVQLWPEPFFVRDANGKEIVVLLADTQGTFDLQSSTKDNAVIFSFATLISSTLVRYFTHLKQTPSSKVESRELTLPILTDSNDFKLLETLPKWGTYLMFVFIAVQHRQANFEHWFELFAYVLRIRTASTKWNCSSLGRKTSFPGH